MKFRVSILAASALVASLVLLRAPANAGPEKTLTRDPTVPSVDHGWQVVASPNSDESINVLAAVASIPGTKDLWAVGYNRALPPAPSALIEHWDGTQWTLYPAPPGNDDILLGVTALSRKNAWAVGKSQGATSYQTLIQHWNGTSWSTVSSPNVGSESELRGVVAVSGSSIWAVGNSDHGPLIEHWNGSAWTVSLDLDWGGGGLNAVGRVPGTKELWAVGGVNGTTLNEHYVRGSWNLVSAPPGAINSVAAVSATDVWAAGVSVATPRRTLIEHWDGSQWSVVPSPNVSSGDNFLSGLTAVPGTSKVWAVGWASTESGYGTLTLKWNGSAGKVIPSPSPGDSAGLGGVTALSGKNVWAVGDYVLNGIGYDTLVEHYS